MLDVRAGAPSSEQPEEMRLARAVRTENRHPVAEPNLGIERFNQTIPGRSEQREVRADHRALAGAAPRSRIVTAWRSGCACGGPASSNRASLVLAACSRDDIPALYAARIL